MDIKKNNVIILFIILMTIYTAETYLDKQLDGFHSYVSSKGIPVKQLSEGNYRISHLNWYCDIDTTIAKHFVKNNISWSDMFETNLKELGNKTVFSQAALRKKMGVLPKDGTSITLVARQGNVSIPKENVIIRLNIHGALDARTTMVITFSGHVKTITESARKQRSKEIIDWFHYGRYYRLWNTSLPLVIPESVWNLETLVYYRGPLFFMKGKYLYGQLAKCKPKEGIGLAAINRIVHLKGDISTLGFTTDLDAYNTAYENRFKLLAHKLVWSYYVVKEMTDTL